MLEKYIAIVTLWHSCLSIFACAFFMKGRIPFYFPKTTVASFLKFDNVVLHKFLRRNSQFGRTNCIMYISLTGKKEKLASIQLKIFTFNLVFYM